MSELLTKRINRFAQAAIDVGIAASLGKEAQKMAYAKLQAARDQLLGAVKKKEGENKRLRKELGEHKKTTLESDTWFD